MLLAVLLLGFVFVLFVAGIWVVLCLCGLFVAGPLAPHVASIGTAVVVSALCYGQYRQGDVVASRADATTTVEDLPELHATVARVAAQLDVPMPTIAIAETHAPEAMVVGVRPSATRFVLSYGAVTVLDEAELEAVVAHDLAPGATRDAAVMTVVASPVIVAAGHNATAWRHLDEPADEVANVSSWGSSSRSSTRGARNDLFTALLLIVSTVASLAGRLVVSSLSRSRELAADRTSAAVTGDPAALASALRTLEERLDETPTADLREVSSVSALSILPFDPVDLDEELTAWDDGGSIRRRGRRLFRTHPSTARRIAELGALERERR